MDGGAWWAAVHGVAKSQTQLSDFTFTFHFHALEKKMAIHSSILAWRIPGTGEPGRLLSMGSHSQTRLKQLSSSILYWCFSFWLSSLCIIGSSFIHLIRTYSSAFFNGWVIFHCVYVPQLSYPSICLWTSRLLPCSGYYKQCCNEH